MHGCFNSATRLINPTDLDEEEFIQYIEDDDSDTFRIFSFKSQEEPSAVTTTRSSKKIKVVPCVLGQDDSATTKGNIWGCARFFMTIAGEKYMSHHFSSRPLPCANPRFKSTIRGFLVVGLIKEGGSGSSRPDLMMIRLHYVYSMLVDACEGLQLDSLVERVLSQGTYFLSAAFAKQGASSIVELIRKVKKSSPHALAMTRVLSTRFMDIMTHPTAMDVILQCLILFPWQPNEVLYEKVILHFQDLEIHKVGCRSLINCIALIRGDQRVRLLNQIADVSDYLSYDPYG
ncbi:UNVERIFIED_CONTAM: hypothetical protein Sradi_6187300 [Sesamum radiatum]|uniref:Uncharacterized protein n=1 Tax=Sesamum radiatum TaxID=300843 RepID=A0AAW2K9A9_SESRA